MVQDISGKSCLHGGKGEAPFLIEIFGNDKKKR